MANANTEPRALQAALAAPAFSTRGARLASRVADRHVERWAPETGAQRVRSMRSLGFVDRLVSPWIETAQRSASMRMFAGYARNGVAERQGGDVSWVFPRPWYQDELAWMAAARRQREEESYAPESSAPAMFTTRGTYVAPSQSERAVVPSALYEFVAPSLSVASPQPLAAPVGRVGEAYSPLVPLAAVAAAQLMNRAIAPLGRSPVAAERPALRAMLATMLQRAAVSPGFGEQPSRVSTYAPELVTPPAPRASDVAPATEDAVAASPETTLAERYAAQRTQIVELQRIAEQSARRELAARVETARREAAHAVEATRTADAPRAPAARTEAVRTEATDAAQRADRARIEDRIAQRLAERRLHEESRTAAAEHARSLEAPAPTAREVAPAARVPAELGAAIASLPPDLAAYLGARPERAAQAIAELNEVLRTAELLARTSAAGGSVEVARGPRLVMPAGLGGLIATVERAQPVPQMIASPSAFAAPSAPPRARRDVRVPTLAWIQPTAPRTAAPSALGATAAAAPAALAHVAWSDRWLARFTGASTRSLDVLQATSASPELRMQALAAAAPESVFVAPSLAPVRAVAGDEPAAPATAESTPLQRFADDDETPDSVFEQIAASAASSRTPPSWQAPQPAAPVAPTVEATAGDAERFTLADAVVRGAPSAPNAGMAAGLAASPFAPALKHLLPLPASLPFDVRALFGGGVSATYLAGLLASETDEVDVPSAAPTWARWASSEQAIAPMLGERATPELDFTYVAPEADVASRAANDEEAVAATREELAPLTTLRTALLSWTAEAAASPGAPATFAAPTITTSQSAPATHATARAMVDAMTLPMFGDAAHDDAPVSWAMPGMIADRAQGWSVAQERSASDLSLDFVTPELVLAARVYGLGPAEAAQAARLALAGPGQLTAMASAVDRTFVQALAIDAERREGRTATGERTPDGAPASVDGPSAARAEAFESARTPSAFGVERRAPRGAFLWPSASVGAMGLSAAAPDGQQSMSVAALELLAAQAVAELGTYAALGEPDGASPRGRADATSASASTTPSASTVDTDGMLNDSAGEAEVLTAAAAIVPAARRARFDALYVALSQTPSARSWSPAARAARALALAGRGEDAPASAYERAAAAWDVLPVVYATDGASIVDTLDQPTPERAAELQIARAARGPRDMVHVDGRPGLGALSVRAGEALGSYVAPANAPSTPATAAPSARSERETGAVMRAPTAAQELVRTGRPSGRHGGGEVEIPPWFEAAARKMLEDRSGNADGISLAELTLVTAAPSTHIAASTRTAPSAQPVAPAAASGSDSAKNGEPIDIDKIANEVYRQILVMMDAARARNGEPYL